MTVAINGFSREGLRGRELEQRVVSDLLRRAAQGGGGGVVLVEGEPGTGKSLLLREAVDEAAGHGFSLAAGAADQLGQTIQLFALRAALGEPFARFTAGRLGQDVHDAPAWWIGQMRAHLEQRAASNPVLVCMDDVQWACPATLAALRTLSLALKRHPVAWVLARSGAPQHDAEYLFDVLEQDGAVRVSMPSLADDAVAALLTDAFGAPPDQSLTALAAEAAGNPSLLVELIGGLRDDDAVRITGGRAVLVSDRLPRRVHRVARQRLDGLGRQCPAPAGDRCGARPLVPAGRRGRDDRRNTGRAAARGRGDDGRRDHDRRPGRILLPAPAPASRCRRHDPAARPQGAAPAVRAASPQPGGRISGPGRRSPAAGSVSRRPDVAGRS